MSEQDITAEAAPAKAVVTRGERRRRFLREVGSVTLGVLIALLIGEIAEAVRWKVRVTNSMTAMRAELAGNRFNIAERALLAPCISARLDEIDAIIADARRNGRLPAIAAVPRIPPRPVESAAFAVAQGEGIFLHMNRGVARDVALAYSLGATAFEAETAAEREAWRDLRLMERAEGAIDGDTLLALRQAAIEARSRNGLVAALLRQADGRLAELRVPVEYGRYKDAAGLRAEVGRYPMCSKPIVG